MATDLVSLVMDFLTPDMIGRIASALGLDRNLVQSAINAVVPSLLAGFSSVAAQPGSLQKVVDAAQQQTGRLESFAETMRPIGGQASNGDRRCFRRSRVAKTKMRWLERSVSLWEWARARPDRYSGCLVKAGDGRYEVWALRKALIGSG